MIDWFGVNVSVGVGKGPWLQKAIQTPNFGGGVYGAYNPGGGKTLIAGGKQILGGGVYFNQKGVAGGYGYVGFALLPFTGYRSF